MRAGFFFRHDFPDDGDQSDRFPGEQCKLVRFRARRRRVRYLLDGHRGDGIFLLPLLVVRRLGRIIIRVRRRRRRAVFVVVVVAAAW